MEASAAGLLDLEHTEEVLCERVLGALRNGQTDLAQRWAERRGAVCERIVAVRRSLFVHGLNTLELLTGSSEFGRLARQHPSYAATVDRVRAQLVA